MISCIADNIISPYGEGTNVNVEAVLHPTIPVHTFPKQPSFVDLAVQTVRGAIKDLPLTDRTVLILSTTKGDNLVLNRPAKIITQTIGLSTEPIVVSNACTSGVCAQITAMRLLKAGIYDTAIVLGCELITPFITSGFIVLKALSDEPCRPFDKNRKGLNLGEGAACIVLSTIQQGQWVLQGGSIHNDANHISGPSRTAEGSYRCLEDLLPDNIDFISLHGTSTVYNDEMESIALHRAGLQDVPVSSYKGIFGHTLGTAGVLETIITMHCLEQGIAPGTYGYDVPGTTYPLNLSAQNRPLSNPRTFIKLLSGFGGCNAAVKYTRLCCQ